MKRNKQKIFYLVLGACVPFLYLFSPKWIALSGVEPNWGLLWLLPWALEEGPIAGIFGGLCCGLILDAMVLDGVTQIPSFMFLGYWWGALGMKAPVIDKSFNLGLLALIGSLINGLLIWAQQILLFNREGFYFMNSSIFHILLAQTIITGLLAPMLCSWSLLSFFRKKY